MRGGNYISRGTHPAIIMIRDMTSPSDDPGADARVGALRGWFSDQLDAELHDRVDVGCRDDRLTVYYRVAPGEEVASGPLPIESVFGPLAVVVARAKMMPDEVDLVELPSDGTADGTAWTLTADVAELMVTDRSEEAFLEAFNDTLREVECDASPV